MAKFVVEALTAVPCCKGAELLPVLGGSCSLLADQGIDIVIIVLL